MDKNHLIEPENLGLWVVATFIIALLALVIGFTSLYRTAMYTGIAQVQVLELTQKVQALSAKTKP